MHALGMDAEGAGLSNQDEHEIGEEEPEDEHADSFSEEDEDEDGEDEEYGAGVNEVASVSAAVSKSRIGSATISDVPPGKCVLFSSFHHCTVPRICADFSCNSSSHR